MRIGGEFVLFSVRKIVDFGEILVSKWWLFVGVFWAVLFGFDSSVD